MEVLKNFGFDPVMLVAQIVNFLIILYLLKRFLYKPLLAMLKKREDSIKEGIKQAEEARQTLEKTLEQEKKILTKAREEAKKIIDEAKLQSREISLGIEENTRKQAERMIAQAREQIRQEAKETERKLMEKTTILASEMLVKSLQGLLGEKEQKQIVNKAIKQIKKAD